MIKLGYYRYFELINKMCNTSKNDIRVFNDLIILLSVFEWLYWMSDKMPENDITYDILFWIILNRLLSNLNSY